MCDDAGEADAWLFAPDADAEFSLGGAGGNDRVRCTASSALGFPLTVGG